MKKALLTKLMLLLCALIAGSLSVWAATDVTYTITSATAVSTSGTAPTNSSATFVNTYTSNKAQMTGGNSQTLTLSGYNGYKITKLVLSMKSNTSSGAGKLSYSTNGGTSFTYLVGTSNSGVGFNDATWNGEWSTSFTNVTKNNLNIICSSSNVVIKIEATANSLFCQSYTITYESSGISSPSISADNVDIAYNATAGSIAYTIDNGVAGGAVTSATVTSSTPDGWLTVNGSNPYSSPIELTCSDNPTNAARTATVTLTYTYNTNQTVTKNVIVTQAANPNVFDDISTITANNTTYAVKGTVVATNAKGLVIGDGTGYVYYYKNAAVSQSVGDKITISGTTGSYNHVLQFTNTATLNEAATSSYTTNTPAVAVVDATAIATYNADLHLSDYVQFQGALAKDNNNNYNITVGTATARISYPTDAQKTALDALVSKTVRVKGYFTGFSSSNFTVMLESAEEVAVPTITATPSSRSGFFYMPGNGPSAAKTISVAGSNLTTDISLSTSTNYEMCLTENGDYTNSLTLTQTTGTVTATTVYVRLKAGLTSNDYAGTITLTSTGATNVTVNLSGSVAALASLPFSWTGTSSAGKTELAAVTGVEVNLGNDYATSNAPYRLKFDGNGKYVIVYTNEKPEAVTFTAKLYGAANTGSKIKVQGSADGITFTDIQEFTIKGAQNATFLFTTTSAFNANHRAVKLIMSNQDQNVGVGYIGISGTSFPIIPAKDYTTLTSTFPLDFTGLANLEAYIVTDNDASDGYVTLTQVNKVPANTGLVLKAASTGSPIDVPVFDGTGADDVTGNLMAGSATETTAIAANAGYILKDGAFHPASAGTLPAGKAYLNISASAPVLLLNFDGDVTGVNEVRGKMEDVRGGMYDLQGRKVAQPSKGLYIVNGKKYVVK